MRKNVHPLRYRVWAGFTIWIGLTAVGFVIAGSGNEDAGAALSLLGFGIALAWALHGPERWVEAE